MLYDLEYSYLHCTQLLYNYCFECNANSNILHSKLHESTRTSVYCQQALIYDNLIRYSSMKHSMTVIDSGYGTKILDICLKDKDETHHWISEEVLRRVFNSLAEQRSFNAKEQKGIIIFIAKEFNPILCFAFSCHVSLVFFHLE